MAPPRSPLPSRSLSLPLEAKLLLASLPLFNLECDFAIFSFWIFSSKTWSFFPPPFLFFFYSVNYFDPASFLLEHFFLIYINKRGPICSPSVSLSLFSSASLSLSLCLLLSDLHLQPSAARRGDYFNFIPPYKENTHTEIRE